MTEEVAPHPDAVALSREDRAHSLDALHVVESMAASPGPTRPEAWRDDLLAALLELGASLHEQFQDSRDPEGLLSEIVHEFPNLASSVAELMGRQTKLIETIDELSQRLADLSRPVDVESLRGQLAEITAELRELRAWETDIVYEAYAVDLGEVG